MRFRNNQFSTNGAMYYFCTYFDRNYLLKGLALYNSLRRYCTTFKLWALCLDSETFDTLTRLSLPSIVLLPLTELEQYDPQLQAVKRTRSLVEYYWTCTPELPLYILERDPNVDIVTYLDADLYFFQSPSPIYQELGNSSILIVEHRSAPPHAHYAATNGIYNVSINVFRRDENGLACLHWWRERCLEWCYYRPEDGKMGDQKYLDEWPQRFERVAIVKQKGIGVAPWNIQNYELSRQGGRLYVDNNPLITYHFHGFRLYNSISYQPTDNSEYVFTRRQL